MTTVGRLMILTMGFAKWIKKIPSFDDLVIKSMQQYMSFGERLELLSESLADKVDCDDEFFANADANFDIMWYWYDVKQISLFLESIGLTPVQEKVNAWATVAETNQTYLDKINKWYGHCRNVNDPYQSRFRY